MHRSPQMNVGPAKLPQNGHLSPKPPLKPSFQFRGEIRCGFRYPQRPGRCICAPPTAFQENPRRRRQQEVVLTFKRLEGLPLDVEAMMGIERRTIGQLAKSFGIATSAIRHYEAKGLLPRARRSGSGYRLYAREDERRLQLVLRARTLGMELPEIRELVKFASTGTCDDFRGKFQSKVTERLKQVDRRIAELKLLRGELRGVLVHLESMTTDQPPDHTLVQCTPDTCACLGPASSTKRRPAHERKAD